jgi:hypothetical protein
VWAELWIAATQSKVHAAVEIFYDVRNSRFDCYCQNQKIWEKFIFHMRIFLLQNLPNSCWSNSYIVGLLLGAMWGQSELFKHISWKSPQNATFQYEYFMNSVHNANGNEENRSTSYPKEKHFMPKANFALASRSKVNYLNMAQGDQITPSTWVGLTFGLRDLQRLSCDRFVHLLAAAYFYINPTAVALSPLEIICIDKTGPAKGAATKSCYSAAGVG